MINTFYRKERNEWVASIDSYEAIGKTFEEALIALQNKVRAKGEIVAIEAHELIKAAKKIKTKRNHEQLKIWIASYENQEQGIIMEHGKTEEEACRKMEQQLTRILNEKVSKTP